MRPAREPQTWNKTLRDERKGIYRRHLRLVKTIEGKARRRKRVLNTLLADLHHYDHLVEWGERD